MRNTSQQHTPLPACTVVMPAYNVSTFIGAAIDSVLNQREVDWRLVVVDDGSSDNTASVVKSYHDTRIQLIQQKNYGVSAARNRGLAEVDTEYVFFLDADDILHPDALARLLSALQGKPEAVAAYGEAIATNEQGKVIGSGQKPFFNHRPSGDVLEKLIRQNFIVLGTICLRTNVLMQGGGFQEGLRIAEDWACWCHVALTGPFVYIGTPPILQYRQRKNSAIRTAGLDPKAALESVTVVFENPRIRKRLGARYAAARRFSEASVFSFAANQPLRDKHWRTARQNLWQSLRRTPWRLREWILLGCALLRYLPPQIARHLK